MRVAHNATSRNHRRTRRRPAARRRLDSARLRRAPLTPRLVVHVDVIAADLPGYGGGPLGTTPPTVAGYAGWLRAFLDVAVLRSCVLGVWLGSAIALRTALDDSARVSGLFACGPCGVDPHVAGGRLGLLAVPTPRVDAPTWWTMRHSRRAAGATLGTVLGRAITEDLVDEVQALATTPSAGDWWVRNFMTADTHHGEGIAAVRHFRITLEVDTPRAAR
jgi:pimeloyl-ACP methyl ester carboxylesterase